MIIKFIISDYNYHGGAQKTANLAEFLQSSGHNVEIIVLRSRSGDIESRPKHFTNILDLNANGLFSSIFKLIKIFKHFESDIFISVGSYSNLSAGLAKLLSRRTIPIIGSENFAKSVLIGDYPKPYFRLLLPLFKLANTQLNGILFVSEKLRIEFLKKNFWHPARCVTIYNPVRSLKKIKAERNINNKKNSGITFLGVGVLEQRKRFDLLLESFSLIARPDDRLLIAGTGSLRNELKTLAVKLGIYPKVKFLGYVSDIESLMKKSDVLVLTSNSEAFGMVLAEGLAAGLQVVSTNSFSGPAEVLGNGRYGFLAEVDNVKSISSSMKAAIDSPISKEMIYEGASRFSANSIVKKYLNFIAVVTESEFSLFKPLKNERKTKRILINVSVITKVYRGMAVFTKQIVRELIKNDNYEYIFVTGNDLDDEITQLILQSTHIYVQINAPLPIFDQIVIPYLIKKYNPDASWFPSNTFPLIGNNKSKFIVTIHDLIFFMKGYSAPDIYQKMARYYRVMNILIGAKKLHKITSVSNSAMKEINERLQITKKIDDKAILYNSLFIVRESINNIFKILNISPTDKYFYSIVGIEKHKNLKFLIDSFQRFQVLYPNYKLIISGASKSKYNNKFKDIIFTSFVSEKEKTSLIKNAELFIFPSLIEGFGIPLIEGLYHNPNVLVSDIPIFNEIGKNYVNYFDPYDKNFIIKFFENKTSLIDHDLAKNYIFQNFNVNKSVQKLENIFNDLQ